MYDDDDKIFKGGNAFISKVEIVPAFDWAPHEGFLFFLLLFSAENTHTHTLTQKYCVPPPVFQIQVLMFYF